MRSKVGTVCMALGAMLMLIALSLFLLNQQENNEAGDHVEHILPQVIEQIDISSNTTTTNILGDNPNYLNPDDPTMTEVEIDGYTYIGYLSIPNIELELPIMSEWDYSKLKLSPCHYSGSTKTNDLIICAHNYTRHFGPIRNLSSGDLIYFTDMNGMIWKYEVDVVEILPPANIEEMIAGDYDLTLFTCTYGGQSRVTVRCRCLDKGFSMNK